MSRHEELQPPIATTSPPEQLTLAVIAACGGGTCPTIYRTGRGTLVVQGRSVAAECVGVELGPEEHLVEIPESLIAELTAGN
jgi:hypothetical protein